MGLLFMPIPNTSNKSLGWQERGAQYIDTEQAAMVLYTVHISCGD